MLSLLSSRCSVTAYNNFILQWKLGFVLVITHKSACRKRFYCFPLYYGEAGYDPQIVLACYRHKKVKEIPPE